VKAHNGMKPQDIAILLFICQYSDGSFKMLDIANSLKISQSEVSESINRSKIAKLIDTQSKMVFRRGLYDFLVHGLRYVFPILAGPIVKGIPTAHSGPPLNKKILPGDEHFVWKYTEGSMRGMAIEPLYKTLPSICEKHNDFYELLCLVDALRIGRIREVNFAKEILKMRLIPNG